MAMVLLVASVLGWAGVRNFYLFIASSLAAFLSSASFAMECVFHSPASEFTRDNISTYYYDEPTLNTIGVLTATLGLAVPGGLWGMAVRLSKQRILKYWLEVTLAVSSGIVIGTIAVCLNCFWLPFGDNFSVFIGGFAVGTILGAAAGYTRRANLTAKKANLPGQNIRN